MGNVLSTPSQLRYLMRLSLRSLAWMIGLQRDKLLLRRIQVDWRFRRDWLNGLFVLSLNICFSLLRLLRLITVPEVFCRYLAAVVAFQTVYEIALKIRSAIYYVRRQITTRGSASHRLTHQMNNANSFEERQAIAQVLDAVEGNDKWREDPKSKLFDYERVQAKLNQYKRLQLENDPVGLMFYLRAGLLRKHWGLGNPKLYGPSHAGTKHIIEEYQKTVCSAMELIKNAESGQGEDQKEDLSNDNKLAFFNETRHSFGRSALLLSGGGALGLYHAGVIKALHENNVLPNVISGASAGSIVAGVVGVRTDAEIPAAFEPGVLDFRFFGTGDNIPSEVIDSCSPGWFKYLEQVLPTKAMDSLKKLNFLVWRFKKEGYLLDINILKECLKANIGNYTFREAYDRTGRIINITVTSTSKAGYPMLLNYLTAPNILIWSACLASCAIPMIFSPVELQAKDSYGKITPYYPEGLKWSDGSVECDLPMERLSELFNVNHFIVSQVNIHYKFFSGYNSLGDGKFGELVAFLKKQLKAYIQNMAELALNTDILKFLGIGIIPLITQRYEGDITIKPNERVPFLHMAMTVLKNPSVADYAAIVKCGERGTWEHIPRIQTMCQIEFALEHCVRYFRAQQAIEDAKQGRPLGRVPSFYTTCSHVNLAALGTNAENSMPIRRNKSMNVAGAVMTMETADFSGFNRSSV